MDNLFTLKQPSKVRYRIINEDEPAATELQWAATFYLGESDIDDTFEDTATTEVIIEAPDFETAVKYAQQYIRKMQTESETKDLWSDAEILSIELR